VSIPQEAMGGDHAAYLENARPQIRKETYAIVNKGWHQYEADTSSIRFFFTRRILQGRGASGS